MGRHNMFKPEKPKHPPPSALGWIGHELQRLVSVTHLDTTMVQIVVLTVSIVMGHRAPFSPKSVRTGIGPFPPYTTLLVGSIRFGHSSFPSYVLFSSTFQNTVEWLPGKRRRVSVPESASNILAL
ncbi:hypothetical protein C8R43DRAFT_1102103, partial [Mycena crocata]